MPDGSRTYTKNKKKYVSVTTIIKTGLNKPALNNWVVKNIADFAMKNPEVLALPYDEGMKVLTTLGTEKRDSAAKLGTSVHNDADHTSKGTVNKSIIPEEATPFIDSFTRFCSDYQPVPLYTEAEVYSDRYEYAGTLDAIYEIGGKVYVCDLKTGRRIYEEVALQLAAYRNADYILLGRKEIPMPKIDGAIVLHLRPDKYQAKKVQSGPEVFDAFLACYDMYNWIVEGSKWVFGNDLDVPV